MKGDEHPFDPSEYVVEKTLKANGAASGNLIPLMQLPFSRIATYTVKRLLPATGLGVIWGPPKCGKSFWCFDVSLHVALGWKYRGRNVKQGPVVYLALEGHSGYSKRKEAVIEHYNLDRSEDIPLYLRLLPMKLHTDRNKLLAEIKSQLGDVKPRMIVLDTLNRAIDGSENNDEDMGRLIYAADMLISQLNCFVLVVHHSGVDANRPRGHTSLGGGVEVQLACKKSADGIVTVTIEWAKDEAEGDVIVSRLKKIDLGADNEGDQIVSCIIEPVEGDQAEAAKKSNKEKSGWSTSTLRSLRDAILNTSEMQREIQPFLDGPTVKATDREIIRTEFYKASPAESDTQRQAFYRAMTEAQDRKLIGVRELDGTKFVWLTADQGGLLFPRASTA